ncbi:MAG: hypothetical protein AAF412_08750, partial [Pseudomonadota bacterium]
AITSAIKFPIHTKERLTIEPEARAAELGPWLARIGAAGFSDGLRRTANVGPRFFQLFLMHGAWQAQDLDAAVDRCGMDIVAFDSVPLPAVNGELMQVPLSDAQVNQIKTIHARIKEFAGVSDSFTDVEAMESFLGKQPNPWLMIAVGIAQESPEKAVLFLERFKHRLDRASHFWSLLCSFHHACGNIQQVEIVLEEASAKWSDGRWLNLMRDRLGIER